MNLERERERLRRQGLLSTLYTAWPLPVGFGLLRASLSGDLPCSAECLERELGYLADRGLVVSTPRHPGGVSQHRLSAAGVDAVEAGEEWDAGRRRQVRMLRLRVLQALDLGRPHPLGLRLIGLALREDTDLDLTEPSLRRAVAYLAAREMAETQGDLTRITAAGVDYLAGEGDACDGIARPAGW